MALDSLIKTVLSELKVAINSKTVIGEPTTFKNWTVIPVTRVSFGFGVGGGNGKADAANFGGGSGGGATIEPVAFIAISDKEVKLISLKEKETIWEKILKPEVGEKIYNKLMGIAENQDVTVPASDSDKA
ncbi:MAG TPA: spore germination protein GerW family protein [Candidatus Rifleibacterium sp.]|nr:spore germination protein GerW family protein [Candidatus Rifleibacterium sp.]HPT46615.1 spore germination protein GerW family protein [Candidatus Rifleibacterium sp.]